MTRIFAFNLYLYLIIVLSFYISQVLSNSTTIQKREISKNSDGTLRFIMQNRRRCGGTIVFSSFEATMSSDNKVTMFLKGAIPGGLILSNSTTIQKREISKNSDGTLRFIMQNRRRCGGTIVFSSFEATMSSDNKVTMFLKGAIPGGLSQPKAQASFYVGTMNSSKVVCHYSPYTITSIYEDSCIIDSGSAITFYFSYWASLGYDGLREGWGDLPGFYDSLEMSFSLWSPDSVIQGCVIGSVNGKSKPIPGDSGFQITYNTLFLSGVIIGLISSFTSYALITGTGSNIPPISKNQTVGNPDVESSTVEKLAVGRFQPPSVYDIFRASQFFVTTSLLSLTHLPDNYRELISKFSWTIGLPSFNVESLSNVADNQRRKACHMSNPPSSGFITSGRIMNIPDYNLFFCVIIESCIVLAIALVITLLLGLFARLSKFLQKKWSIVKTAASNIHFLVLGGMFRVLLLFYYPLTLFAAYQLSFHHDCWFLLLLAAICIIFISLGMISFCSYKILQDLSHDRDAFNTPVHTFIYGALYTQYRDHSEMKQTCLWFFVFTFAYDVIRAIATGGARQSGAVQTSLIVILLIPFLVNSINFLKSLILALQFIIIGSLFMVILLQLIDLIRGFIRKDKGNDDANVN
ncbi:hypothetical protein Glove_97g13 [Diversispora epigaea]|uniref:TRP C-terminal domain-containing protein n=1 Tax=Diversispora epigaea TaxID=1348612 RepID=A0A397J756_9GLOM|nr:hypothetical protein Glove_97g13 [Diversispora epigaea]